MKIGLWKKGLVFGIILLFVGISVQPGIIADDIIESDNSEMVEITIEICNGDEAYDHTMMLTQEQAEELESIINSTKTKLDAAETLKETFAIYNETVVSLYELGVLPDGMSIENAKRLVNGREQNPRIVKKLERWLSRNQRDKGLKNNFLCLIAGHTDMTVFIGPLLIPSLILVYILAAPFMLLDNLLDGIFDIDTNFGTIVLLPLLFVFGGLNFLTWQFNPLAFGHIIKLGGSGGFGGRIPADGWINTIGLNGIRNWDRFYGLVLGFTGIKICYPSKSNIFPQLDITHFYMGAALSVNENF